MPNVDGVLRDIAKCRYIIVSDLHHAFYQIPLSKESMKYCGIVTPYRGVRVYTRAAMGVLGSETCLEELLSIVLGELIQEGVVTKLADDLYCGGNSVDELYHNWACVLSALQANNLKTRCSQNHRMPPQNQHSGMGVIKWNPLRIPTSYNVIIKSTSTFNSSGPSVIWWSIQDFK